MPSNSDPSNNNQNTPKISPSHGHGGQLTQASKKYNIPISEWIDLSTGISPFIYPLSTMPNKYWQRLPETNDGLEDAAHKYYGSENLLPVSGSQEAIQRLPLIFPLPLTVGLVSPAYHSHQQAWEKAGHKLVLINPDEIEKTLESIDILLLVNPTNPTCHTYKRKNLLKWHEELANKNGYLIVDEAFMDCTPENSLIEQTPKQGLIVLRSIGKFFGLAGIRLGFVWAETDILQNLLTYQDDWSVSNPARWAGRKALQDFSWQQQQRVKLNQNGKRLYGLLDDSLKSYTSNISPKSGEVCLTEIDKKQKYLIKHTPLFVYIEHLNSDEIHKKLAQQGILTRLFVHKKEDKLEVYALRFGLPADEREWLRLERALNKKTIL